MTENNRGGNLPDCESTPDQHPPGRRARREARLSPGLLFLHRADSIRFTNHAPNSNPEKMENGRLTENTATSGGIPRQPHGHGWCQSP